MLKSLKDVNNESETLFRFNFVEESIKTTKKKKKKKKKTKSSKIEESDTVDGFEVDNEECSDDDSEVGVNVSTSDSALNIKQNMVCAVESIQQQESSIDSEFETKSKSVLDIPAACAVSVESTIDEKSNKSQDKTKTKKKKKKNEASNTKTMMDENDDDLYLASIIAEVKSIEQEMQKKEVEESRERAKSSKLRFFSHKDPELSDLEARRRKYGKGLNLTAIGPVRRKKDLESWVVSGESCKAKDVDSRSTSDAPSTTSPFSFGFSDVLK